MKVDLKRTLEEYRARRGEWRLLDVPPATYLMVDGSGDPNTAPAYTRAIAALYPVAYTLKLLSKQAGRDYVVMPLEGLWWADDMAAFTSRRDKSRWRWTLMIRLPDWTPPGDLDEAVARVGAKRTPPADLALVRRETLHEGRCLQTLHVGAYDDEGPLLAQLHDEVAPARGLRLTGRHHEIYLGDARRTAPERLRTVLRQPVV